MIYFLLKARNKSTKNIKNKNKKFLMIYFLLKARNKSTNNIKK